MTTPPPFGFGQQQPSSGWKPVVGRETGTAEQGFGWDKQFSEGYRYAPEPLLRQLGYTGSALRDRALVGGHWDSGQVESDELDDWYRGSGLTFSSQGDWQPTETNTHGFVDKEGNLVGTPWQQQGGAHGSDGLMMALVGLGGPAAGYGVSTALASGAAGAGAGAGAGTGGVAAGSSSTAGLAGGGGSSVSALAGQTAGANAVAQGAGAMSWLDWINAATAVYGATRKPPPAPDYTGAAREQGAQDRQTAIEQTALNRLDENTPLGNIRYTRVEDPTMPGGFRYQRDVNLSPEQQELYGLETGNQLAGQRVASGMQGRLADAVRDPFRLSGPGLERVSPSGDPMSVAGPQARDLGTAATYAGGADKVRDALYQRTLALRQPQMDRQTASLETQLRNQGLVPGTEAYDNALGDLRQSQSQELNDLAFRATEAGGAEQSRLAGLDMGLNEQRFGQEQVVGREQLQRLAQSLSQRLGASGFNNQVRGQGIQEQLLERQQPLSEYNAFRTGNSPTMPQFQPYSMVGTPQSPQTYQATRDQYGASLDQYNARQGQWQSLLNFGTKLGSRP